MEKMHLVPDDKISGETQKRSRFRENLISKWTQVTEVWSNEQQLLKKWHLDWLKEHYNFST